MLDLVIVGCGPAGLTASIYASCFNLNHIVVGKLLGGQMNLAPDILNYPGFDEISGSDLTKKMVEQVKKRGGQVVENGVSSISKNGRDFILTCEDGTKYEAKSIILATGFERRKLNIPGETEYIGKGVQYCAKCETSEYDKKIVAVAGGANSAAQAAVQLSSAATKVYIIYRGGEMRCDPIWMSQIKQASNIEIIYNSQILEIKGDGEKITGIKIKSTSQQGESTEKDIILDRLYVEIGGVPGTAMLIPLGVTMDEGGFLQVDDNLSTNVQGIFAAGDVISHKYSIEQISSAVGLGAHAATSVFSYLKQQKAPSLWGTAQIKR